MRLLGGWQIFLLPLGMSNYPLKDKNTHITRLIRQVQYKPVGFQLSEDESAALSARKMKDRIGFVRQNDYLLEHLTGASVLALDGWPTHLTFF